jgi:hypothetical protein
MGSRPEKKGDKKADANEDAFEQFKEYERWKTFHDNEYNDAPSGDTERAYHGLQSKYTGLDKKQEGAMRTRSANARLVTWDREQRRGGTGANDEEREMPGHRHHAYLSMGDATAGLYSGLTTHLRNGIAKLDDETTERLGIPTEGMESVYKDPSTTRLKLEDGGRIERLAGEGKGYSGLLAPKEDAAMKYRCEKITDATNE